MKRHTQAAPANLQAAYNLAGQTQRLDVLFAPYTVRHPACTQCWDCS